MKNENVSLRDDLLVRVERYMKFLAKWSKHDGFYDSIIDDIDNAYWDLRNLKYSILSININKYEYARVSEILDETIKPLVEIIRLER